MPIWLLLVLIAAAIGLITLGPAGMLLNGISALIVFGGLRLLGAVFRGDRLSLPRIRDDIFDDSRRRIEDEDWDRFGGTRR
jgi:hypothetical protein